MARNPAWLLPATVIAGVVGLVWTAKTLASEASSKFLKQGGVQFWNPSLAPQIAKFLGGAHVERPDPAGSPRWYRLLPGAAGGEGNALALVKAIQAKGNQVMSTVNLLEAGEGARGIGELTPAEVAGIVVPDFAILPKL